jgi:2-hydroxy-3-oxopropionate reductase
VNSGRLGFIGLGAMGQPMALNLLRAGYALTVYNRTAERALPVQAAGADVARTPADVAAASQIVFINVADEIALSEVLFGAAGALEKLAPGSIVVDLGTTSPTTTRCFADRLSSSHVDWMDAPVSGGEVGAKAATLSIMVGASVDTYTRVQPVLQCMGQNIVHIGEVGAGQVTKACNQIVVSATLLGVAEAIVFAQQQGVDAARVRTALLGGFAYSRILEVHGQRMLDEAFVPGFRSRLHLKDLNLVHGEATASGLDLPLTRQALQVLDALVASGSAELDSSALIRVVREASQLPQNENQQANDPE